MNNWTKIYSNGSLARATIVVNLLTEKEIPASLLNRKDSAYVFLGEAEVYVPAEFVNIAKDILSTIELDLLDASL